MQIKALIFLLILGMAGFSYAFKFDVKENRITFPEGSIETSVVEGFHPKIPKFLNLKKSFFLIDKRAVSKNKYKWGYYFKHPENLDLTFVITVRAKNLIAQPGNLTMRTPHYVIDFNDLVNMSPVVTVGKNEANVSFTLNYKAYDMLYIDPQIYEIANQSFQCSLEFFNSPKVFYVYRNGVNISESSFNYSTEEWTTPRNITGLITQKFWRVMAINASSSSKNYSLLVYWTDSSGNGEADKVIIANYSDGEVYNNIEAFNMTHQANGLSITNYKIFNDTLFIFFSRTTTGLSDSLVLIDLGYWNISVIDNYTADVFGNTKCVELNDELRCFYINQDNHAYKQLYEKRINKTTYDWYGKYNITKNLTYITRARPFPIVYKGTVYVYFDAKNSSTDVSMLYEVHNLSQGYSDPVNIVNFSAEGKYIYMGQVVEINNSLWIYFISQNYTNLTVHKIIYNGTYSEIYNLSSVEVFLHGVNLEGFSPYFHGRNLINPSTGNSGNITLAFTYYNDSTESKKLLAYREEYILNTRPSITSIEFDIQPDKKLINLTLHDDDSNIAYWQTNVPGLSEIEFSNTSLVLNISSLPVSGIINVSDTSNLNASITIYFDYNLSNFYQNLSETNNLSIQYISRNITFTLGNYNISWSLNYSGNPVFNSGRILDTSTNPYAYAEWYGDWILESPTSVELIFQNQSAVSNLSIQYLINQTNITISNNASVDLTIDTYCINNQTHTIPSNSYINVSNCSWVGYSVNLITYSELENKSFVNISRTHYLDNQYFINMTDLSIVLNNSPITQINITTICSNNNHTVIALNNTQITILNCSYHEYQKDAITETYSFKSNYTSHTSAIYLTNGSYANDTIYVNIKMTSSIRESFNLNITFNLSDYFASWTSTDWNLSNNKIYKVFSYSDNMTATARVSSANVLSYHYTKGVSDYRLIVNTTLNASLRDIYVKVDLPIDTQYDPNSYHLRYWVCISNPDNNGGCGAFSSPVDVTADNDGSNCAENTYCANLKNYQSGALMTKISFNATTSSPFVMAIQKVSGAFSPSPGTSGGGGGGGVVEEEEEITQQCPSGYHLCTLFNKTMCCPEGKVLVYKNGQYLCDYPVAPVVKLESVFITPILWRFSIFSFIILIALGVVISYRKKIIASKGRGNFYMVLISLIIIFVVSII